MTLPPAEERVVPARAAILTIVVALLLGALLNADMLRRTAETQPEGWRRETGLRLVAPLTHTSRMLRFDEPRAAARSALGRPDERAKVVVTFRSTVPAVRSPTELTNHPRATRTAAPRRAPHKPAFSRSRKLRLLAAGDSLGITPGWALYRLAERNGAINPVAPVDGRVATGLARPDVFDWFDHLRRQAKKLRLNAVVLSFGGNDDQSAITGLRSGVRIGSFGSRSWLREYRRRVGGVIDDLTASGVYVVWLGLPVTRDAAQTRRFEVLNRVFSSEALRRPDRAAYVDTSKLLVDPKGRYTDYLPGTDGDLVRVRAEDGVHFDRAGGDLIANHVLAALRTKFVLQRRP